MESFTLGLPRRHRRHGVERTGAEAVHICVSEQENAVYIRDEFEDAGAMGFHISTTAADHFPQLLAIAAPGPFFFFGTYPKI